MFRATRVLACLLVVCGLGLLGPAAALAQGPGSSAGDQQYVDPLASSGNSSSSSSSSGSSSSDSSSTSSSDSGSQSGSDSSSSSSQSSGDSSSSTTTTGSTASSGQSQSAQSTLPFTGLNIGACIAAGIVLIACGLALRRTTRRA